MWPCLLFLDTANSWKLESCNSHCNLISYQVHLSIGYTIQTFYNNPHSSPLLVQMVEDDEKTPVLYSPDHTTDRYNPNYPDHTAPQPTYTPPHPDYNPQPSSYNPQIQPVYNHDNPQSPAYSPQQQTTTFNARLPSRQQVARQHRYEARRAKVEQVNNQLNN